MSSSFKSSRPAPSVCPRCSRVCLSGWAEGLLTRVDLTTLSPVQYPLAILRGVRLYWLDPIGLAYVDRHRIKDAGRNGYPVLPRHHCAIVWPTARVESLRTDDTIPY